MEKLIQEVDLAPAISSAALHEGVALAFESPDLFPRYFRSQEGVARWASGLGIPGHAPEPAMRDRILKGMAIRGAPTRTLFSPEVPTWICGGGGDPYHRLTDFERAITAANLRRKSSLLRWFAFPHAGHYPYVDAYEKWRDSVWIPFQAAVRG